MISTDVIWTHILPRLSIDLRIALGVRPGRLNLISFEHGPVGMSLKTRYSQQYIAGETHVVVPMKQYGTKANGRPQSYYRIVYRWRDNPRTHPDTLIIRTYRFTAETSGYKKEQPVVIMPKYNIQQ